MFKLLLGYAILLLLWGVAHLAGKWIGVPMGAVDKNDPVDSLFFGAIFILVSGLCYCLGSLAIILATK